MTQTGYARAVALFDALVHAPGTAAHETPAGLIQAAGIPSSSGYRHVAALEAEGFLRRNPAGTYLTGVSSIRTGFSGYGLGSIAPLSQPILLRLRQATQHTAFLAIVRDLDLHMGPYSVGRETRGTQLQPCYGFETIPELALGRAEEATLRSQDGQVVRRTHALLAPVMSSLDAMVVLGLVLQPGWGTTDQLSQSLESAAAQITEALQEV